MGKKLKIALVVSAAFLVAAGLIIYFHQLQKRARIHQMPGITEFVGVGIALREDTRIHAAVIQQIIPNSPAAAAGITNGLFVSRVDGVSMAGKPLAECVKFIRGPAGSTVQLELVTPDRSQTNTVELTRQKFKL
jgi:C-terminal processing protease CtpA/Prc